MGNPGSMRKLRAFWQRTSDGLNAEQLWAQFRRETRSSLNLYSAETGRNLQEEWSAKKGRRRGGGRHVRPPHTRATPVTSVRGRDVGDSRVRLLARLRRASSRTRESP